jgi:hypothetical protein
MFWLSRLSGNTSCVTGVALPMILIGGGQGATLSPLAASGIAGATPEDAGASAGLVNVALVVRPRTGSGTARHPVAHGIRHWRAHRARTRLTSTTNRGDTTCR